jgi:hypothetical protein
MHYTGTGVLLPGYYSAPKYNGYPGEYCKVPAGTAAVPVLWVLQMGTVQYPQYPLVLQGTVGTARAKVTVGYFGSARGYSRVLWVLRVLQGTGYCGYCRCVLQGVQKVGAQSAVRNTYRN